MGHTKSWMRALFAVTLLFPNLINGAEVTQKIRIGLPSVALFSGVYASEFSSDF